MFIIKICRRLDSNSGPLVLEATTQPPELHNHSPFFLFFIKVCHSRPLLVYLHLFYRLTVNMFIVKIFRRLDSNSGPLVLEATTLPPEPHNHCPFLSVSLPKQCGAWEGTLNRNPIVRTDLFSIWRWKGPKKCQSNKTNFSDEEEKMKKIGNIFLKNIGHSLPLFHLLSSFQISTQLTVNVQYKFYPWLDSNRGSLKLEATNIGNTWSKSFVFLHSILRYTYNIESIERLSGWYCRLLGKKLLW